MNTFTGHEFSICFALRASSLGKLLLNEAISSQGTCLLVVRLKEGFGKHRCPGNTEKTSNLNFGISEPFWAKLLSPFACLPSL